MGSYVPSTPAQRRGDAGSSRMRVHGRFVRSSASADIVGPAAAPSQRTFRVGSPPDCGKNGCAQHGVFPPCCVVPARIATIFRQS